MTTAPRQIEHEVEGLRALAALMVLYTHLFAPHHDVDPGYQPSETWYRFEAGQGAVLLFFVLSGYVIGLTNQGTFSAAAGRRYLWRRFVRLVPLFWIALALSVAVLPVDSWPVIVGNVFFLHNDLPYGPVKIPLLVANTNLWSLNYEALYYLLFVGLWAWNFGAIRPGVAAAMLVVLGLVIPGFPAFLTNYAAGWMFWLAGLWLARAERATEDRERWPWPSLLLFALASWKIKPLFFLVRRAGLALPTDGWVNFTYLDFIPVCTALVMIVALRRPKQAWALVYTAAAVPVAFLAWRVLRGRLLADEIAVYDIIVLAGMALWWFRPSLQLFRWLAPLGAISYGIYIFQRPAQWLIAYHTWLPAGGPATFWLRAAIITVLTLLLAWLAEKKLQPVIKRLLLRSA